MAGRLLDLSASELLGRFGAGGHKPGSGSAAALQGLLSAHLIKTVIDLTKQHGAKKQYSQHLSRLVQIESELNNRVIPNLERLFQQDSEQFDRVIKARKRRNAEVDPRAKRRLAEEALNSLIPAVEIPIDIAKECIDLANFATSIFDHGFTSARGDSGVAMNAAIASLSGCLSIIELNLLSFGVSSWVEKIRPIRDGLVKELAELTVKAQDRLRAQNDQAERKAIFFSELDEIRKSARGRASVQEAQIEEVAIRLQRAIWLNKDLAWKGQVPSSHFETLNAEIALRCYDFQLERADTLGHYQTEGREMEVAGLIDQQEKTVSISLQFSPEVQHFTAAHELGHALFHQQQAMHRDLPLDGSVRRRRRSGIEWQADKFATYFLMPGKLVTEQFVSRFLFRKFEISEETAFALNGGTAEALFGKCKNLRDLSRLLAKGTLFNSVHFDSISKRFNVSVETMAIRLEELDLVAFRSK